MKRELIITSQFREVSSAGGVGRKFEERAAYCLRFHGRYAEAGIDHQRSVQGSFYSRGGGRKFQERATYMSSSIGVNCAVGDGHGGVHISAIASVFSVIAISIAISAIFQPVSGILQLPTVLN